MILRCVLLVCIINNFYKNWFKNLRNNLMLIVEEMEGNDVLEDEMNVYIG